MKSCSWGWLWDVVVLAKVMGVYWVELLGKLFVFPD